MVQIACDSEKTVKMLKMKNQRLEESGNKLVQVGPNFNKGSGLEKNHEKVVNPLCQWKKLQIPQLENVEDLCIHCKQHIKAN